MDADSFTGFGFSSVLAISAARKGSGAKGKAKQTPRTQNKWKVVCRFGLAIDVLTTCVIRGDRLRTGALLRGLNANETRSLPC